MKKLFFAILFSLLFPVLVFAGWGHLINNYTRSEYHGGSQNWQIAQTDDHRMYFANKMGVLEFNGRDWNLYPLNNNNDTRSLFYSRKEQRIYVGGINEFGYLAPDASGKMDYHCLQDPQSSSGYSFGNIWNIFEIDNSLYFCEDYAVIKYIADTLIPIRSPDKIDCSALINNALHIGTSSGIFILMGEIFYPLPDTEVLRNKKLRAMLPFENKLLIATASEGLFLWDPQAGLKPFRTDVDDFIRENGLFSIAFHEDKIAIGTVLNGVVLLSAEGKLLKYVNESHGLQNNTVLSTYFDRNGNLWLGLDNGIGYVALNYPITTLYSSAKFYGAGYAARLYKDKLYLGTNRGLYVSEWPVANVASAPELDFIEGSQGQVWGLHLVGNDLLMSHDRGLFRVNPGGIEQIDDRSGVWDMYPMGAERDRFWVSHYDGFFALSRHPDNRYEIKPIPYISGSYINSRANSSNELFLRTSRTELLQTNLSEDLNHILHEQSHRSPGIPDDYYINSLDDKIILSGRSGFYYYTGDGAFLPEDTLNQYFPTTDYSDLYRYIEKNNGNIWVLGDNMLAYRSGEMTASHFCYHSIPLISNFERLYPLNDTMVVIPNENGFALWDVSDKHKAPHYPLQVTGVYTTKSTNALSSDQNLILKNGIIEIPYSHNSLVVRYTLVRYMDPNKVQFQTRLDSEPWTDCSFQDFRNLPHIPIGKHTFRVRTQLDNFEVVEDTLQFVILPPWYRTFWAYIGYLLLLILLVLFIREWDRRRIEQKRNQLRTIQKEELNKREAEFKIENEKKEKEIIRLKNEQLEMDIQYKSQKLATSAIVLGRKNEVLIDLKEELLKLFEEAKGAHFDSTVFKRKILQLNNKIDSNINEDDSFQKFEENFDLVHNNFIKRLTAAYPSISIAERKMCAYIKMELSSKEIAPLLNISTRGVETLRYRLRKKLGLNREDSLTQFLMNF